MDIKQEEQSQNINDVIYGAVPGRRAGATTPASTPTTSGCGGTATRRPRPPRRPRRTSVIGPPASGNNCENLVNFGHWNDADHQQGPRDRSLEPRHRDPQGRVRGREQGVRQAVLERVGLLLDLDDPVPDEHPQRPRPEPADGDVGERSRRGSRSPACRAGSTSRASGRARPTRLGRTRRADARSTATVGATGSSSCCA